VVIHEPPANERFSIDIATTDGTVVVRLHGPLDLASAPDVAQLSHALRSTTGPVTLDLADLDFIDSTGISALAGFKGELDVQMRSLVVAGVQPRVLDVLRMVGIDEALGISS